MQGRKKKGNFKGLKRGQHTILYLLKIALKTEGEIFFFSQIEWKEFVASKSVLQEI